MAITVQAANSPPFAADDPAESFGGPFAVEVLANDGDADGEALKVSLVAGAGCVTTCSGTTAVIADVVRFEPSSNLPVACTICYTVTDESGAVARAKIVVAAGSNPLLFFSDGFELGNTSRWSETYP